MAGDSGGAAGAKEVGARGTLTGVESGDTEPTLSGVEDAEGVELVPVRDGVEGATEGVKELAVVPVKSTCSKGWLGSAASTSTYRKHCGIFHSKCL